MKERCLKSFLFIVILSVCVFIACGDVRDSTKDKAKEIAGEFPLKYGVIYSDELSKDDEYYFTPEMKSLILGASAEKYTYIESASGYFSRDMISGSEVLIFRLTDRSHRAEIIAALYRRASYKTDMDARVFCKGDLVFFICDPRAEEIINFIKSKI
ncbi:MAG: hypothetical protein ACI4QR_06075 [Eubacteriales bacterium]